MVVLGAFVPESCDFAFLKVNPWKEERHTTLGSPVGKGRPFYNQT